MQSFKSAREPLFQVENKGRSARKMEDEPLAPRIRAVNEKNMFTYESKRIKADL